MNNLTDEEKINVEKVFESDKKQQYPERLKARLSFFFFFKKKMRSFGVTQKKKKLRAGQEYESKRSKKKKTQNIEELVLKAREVIWGSRVGMNEVLKGIGRLLQKEGGDGGGCIKLPHPLLL